MRNEKQQFVKGNIEGAEFRFKKGQASPRKGIKLSELTRLRISLAKRGLSTDYLKQDRRFLNGRKHSEATRMKISEAHKGMRKPWAGRHTRSEVTRRKLSESFRGKPRPNLRGVNHGAWKGGISSLNSRIRQSFEYKEWRRKVFERDNYTCKDCGQYGGILNADHIKPFALYPELRFEVSNGRTLCEDCHKQTPTYGNKKHLLICSR